MIIFDISLDFSLISPIDVIISSIHLLPKPTCDADWSDTSHARLALSAHFLIPSDISLIVEANSSTELACSVAPCERACAPAATCSEALATCSADKFISEKSPLKSPFAILVNVLSIRSM